MISFLFCGDGRQETGDRRSEIGDRRWEIGGVLWAKDELDSGLGYKLEAGHIWVGSWNGFCASVCGVMAKGVCVLFGWYCAYTFWTSITKYGNPFLQVHTFLLADTRFPHNNLRFLLFQTCIPPYPILGR